MLLPSQTSATASVIRPGRITAAKSERGFTLVEIGIVVIIIGLVAAVAVPQLKKMVQAARSEAIINDLRVFTQAFEHYLQEKGDWPPEQASPGVYPAGMEGYLRQSNWEKQSPIGGFYNWERQIRHNGQRLQAAIAISSKNDILVTTDRMQLEDIDRRLDDGDLTTGKFRLGYRNEPVLIIEP